MRRAWVRSTEKTKAVCFVPYKNICLSSSFFSPDIFFGIGFMLFLFFSFFQRNGTFKSIGDLCSFLSANILNYIIGSIKLLVLRKTNVLD